MRPRAREAERRHPEELRAEQLQAQQQARVQRQSAKEAEQQLLPKASKEYRAYSVLREVTPSPRPHEEMFRQDVRGRTPEATYAPSHGTQYFRVAHEAVPGAEVHR